MADDTQVRVSRAIDPVLRLGMDRIKLTETAHNTFRARAPNDHPPKKWLEPGYLWNRNDLIRVGDVVSIVNDEFTAYALLLVVKIEKDTKSVFTRVIHAVDWTGEELPAASLDDVVIEESGSDQWRVRLGTEVLSRYHSTEAAAHSWLAKRTAKGKE